MSVSEAKLSEAESYARTIVNNNTLKYGYEATFYAAKALLDGTNPVEIKVSDAKQRLLHTTRNIDDTDLSKDEKELLKQFKQLVNDLDAQLAEQ
jgi:hypothetical protein